MSDGISSGGAPVAPAAPAQTQAQTKAAPPKQHDAPPAWGEKDDAELIERLKRSPYGKLKVHGKEEAIDSTDALKRLLLDAQRGKGANQLVEQTKKEREEAQREAAEAKRLKEAVERLRKGDRNAARELGLVADEERRAAEEEWAKLPPEVQRVIQQNQELADRLAQIEAEKQRELQEREEAEKKSKREAVLKRASEMAKEVLKDVREEFHDVELPHVIQAMEALRESGLKMGVDYGVEQLRAYMEQQREASVWEQVGRAKPDVALKRVSPLLKSLKADALESALGEDFVPLAKLFSTAWLGYHKRKSAAPPKPTAQPQQQEEQRQERQPLSRFRMPGR